MTKGAVSQLRPSPSLWLGKALIFCVLLAVGPGCATRDPDEIGSSPRSEQHASTSPLPSSTMSQPPEVPAKFKGYAAEIYAIQWAGCWSSGVEAVADNLNIQSRSPTEVARTAAEQGYPPEYFAPADEGCRDGFEWRVTHPPSG